MSYPSISYYAHSALPVRFFQHARFALTSNTGIEHIKNLREKAGDYGLWAIQNLVPKIWHFVHEPRILNVFFTATAMLAVSFAFYPGKTKEKLKEIRDKLPLPTAGQIKCATYIGILFHLVALGLRTEGRFSNDLLMKAWYAGKTVA